ncbi:hypothetical protein JCM8547_003951 [Rhodosporidiobolus lusitaniae]
MAHPWQTQLASTHTTPLLPIPSTLPLPSSTSLTSPSFSLPPAPPAADLTSARLKLALDKVKLELQGVKNAVDEVSKVGEAVEGVREEVRAEAALEKRILAALDQILLPFTSWLEAVKKAVLEAVEQSETRTAQRVSHALVKVEEVKEAVGAVEQKTREAVEEVSRAVTEDLDERVEGLETRLKRTFEKRDEVEGRVEEWQKQVIEVEKRVEQVEVQLEGLSQQKPAVASPSRPALTSEKDSCAPAASSHSTPRLPSTQSSSTLITPAPAAAISTSSNGQSPPRRCCSSARLTTLSSNTPSSLALPFPNIPSRTALESRTTAAPQLASSSRLSSIPSTTLFSLPAPSHLSSKPVTPSKRWVIQQEDSLERDHVVEAGEGGREGEKQLIRPVIGRGMGAGGSSAAISPASKRRRRIEQDASPAGTQEEVSFGAFGGERNADAGGVVDDEAGEEPDTQQ